MNKEYYIIGLPDSGKTSFIGALGYFLISNETNDSAFYLDNTNDMDYISQVAEQWVNAKKRSERMKQHSTTYHLICEIKKQIVR